MKFYLASGSPRRKKLLEEQGFMVHVHPMKVSEIIDETLNCEHALMELSLRKAKSFLNAAKLEESEPFLVLAADTEVVLDGRTLGKPNSIEEAHTFLTRLSARAHEVKTAVTLYKSPEKKFVSFCETTKIWFKELAESEILAYVASGEPFDKAGGYGIQGTARKFVKHIEGSLSNVIGLPMEKLLQVFYENGWQLPRRPSDEN